ncbi:MAG: (Fe-S)-binding protein, partial [Planctomycetota bacterium]
MAEIAALPRPGPAAPIDSPATLLAYERSLDCVHCGLCLPKCPTYLLTGREPSSPRGRIYLMRSWAEGRISPTDRLAEELDFCLVCRACETVCPAGVRFGEMMEYARDEIGRARPDRAAGGFLRRLLLHSLLPNRARMRRALALLRLYSFPPIRALLRPLLPRELRRGEALLPRVPRRHAPLPVRTPPIGDRRGRVAILRGCVMEPLLPEATAATAAVLARNGWEVVAPEDPPCCGALHAHFGEVERARALARATIGAFEASGAEAMVVDSAGCGSVLKEYGNLLEQDPAWRLRAISFAGKVRDVCEFLLERGFERPARELQARVAYADACHLLHGQRVSVPPREILRSIPGLTLLPLPESDLCCGAAGIYTITNPETSRALLDRKVEILR